MGARFPDFLSEIFSIGAPIIAGLLGRESALEAGRKYPLTNVADFWGVTSTGRKRPEGGPATTIGVPASFRDIYKGQTPEEITPSNLIQTWFGAGFQDLVNQYQEAQAQAGRQLGVIGDLRADNERITREGRTALRETGRDFQQAREDLMGGQRATNAFLQAVQRVPSAIQETFQAAAGQAIALRNHSVGAITEFLDKLTTDVAHKLDAGRQAIDAQVTAQEFVLDDQASRSGMSADELDIAKNGLHYAAGSLLVGQFGGLVAESWDFLRQVGGDALGKITDANIGTAKILGDLSSAKAGALVDASKVHGMAVELKNGLQIEMSKLKAQEAVVRHGIRQFYTGMRRMGMTEVAQLMWDFQNPVLAAAPLYGAMFAAFNAVLGAGNETNLTQQALTASADRLAIEGLLAGSQNLTALEVAETQAEGAVAAAREQSRGAIFGGLFSGTGTAFGGALGGLGEG